MSVSVCLSVRWRISKTHVHVLTGPWLGPPRATMEYVICRRTFGFSEEVMFPTMDRLAVFMHVRLQDSVTAELLFICIYMCNPSTCSEWTTTLKFTRLVLSVLLAVHSDLCRISTPCNIVPQFPFLAVSTPAFWDTLVPLFPFPLFHVSHQRSQHNNNNNNIPLLWMSSILSWLSLLHFSKW